jgi:hypothetical protein
METCYPSKLSSAVKKEKGEKKEIPEQCDGMEPSREGWHAGKQQSGWQQCYQDGFFVYLIREQKEPECG